jgi:hypothetical protein
MFDHTTMRYLIERALDETPWCRACGSPTTIEADGGRYRLLCVAAAHPSGVRARLGAMILPHERSLVVDTGEVPAA